VSILPHETKVVLQLFRQ